jgi:hypothetical protein
MPLSTILSFTGSAGLETVNASKSGGTWAYALNGYGNDYVYDTAAGGYVMVRLFIGGLEPFAATISDVDVRISAKKGDSAGRTIQYTSERDGSTNTGGARSLSTYLDWYQWNNVGCPGAGGWKASYLMNWDTVRFGGIVQSNSGAAQPSHIDCVEVTANWYPMSGGFRYCLRSLIPPILLGAALTAKDWLRIRTELVRRGQRRLTDEDLERMRRELEAWTRPTFFLPGPAFA